MDQSPLYPFADDAETLQRHCKLPLHSGVGRIGAHGDPNNQTAQMVRRVQQALGSSRPDPAKREFAASFLVPATGNCLIFLRWPSDRALNRNFGEGLTITGNSADGPFRLTCPSYYVQAVSESYENPAWAVAAPINKVATVTYGEPRPIARVAAMINNFDFEYGNFPEGMSGPQKGNMLRVDAAGRAIDFAWRKERTQLKPLVDARIIPSTSLVTFSFESWPGASQEELATLAYDVASLCSFVVGQHTGIPVLSFFDSDGRVICRNLVEAVQSEIRPECALRSLHAENGLPLLFRQCFEEHVRMQRSKLWRRLPPLYAAIEDPPYLEQKYATLRDCAAAVRRAWAHSVSGLP